MSSWEPGPAFRMREALLYISSGQGKGSSRVLCTSPRVYLPLVVVTEGVSPGLCLGDDIIHHHVDHCSGGKAQGVGEERLCHHHGEGTEDAG